MDMKTKIATQYAEAESLMKQLREAGKTDEKIGTSLKRLNWTQEARFSDSLIGLGREEKRALSIFSFRFCSLSWAFLYCRSESCRLSISRILPARALFTAKNKSLYNNGSPPLRVISFAPRSPAKTSAFTICCLVSLDILTKPVLWLQCGHFKLHSFVRRARSPLWFVPSAFCQP